MYINEKQQIVIEIDGKAITLTEEIVQEIYTMEALKIAKAFIEERLQGDALIEDDQQLMQLTFCYQDRFEEFMLRERDHFLEVACMDLELEQIYSAKGVQE